MLKKSILCLSVFYAVFFSACAPTNRTVVGVPIQKEKVYLIAKDQTTESEILEIFGEPMNKVLTGEQVLWMYIYQDASTETKMLSTQATMKGRYQKLDISIKDGVVTYYVYCDSPMPIMKGTTAW